MILPLTASQPARGDITIDWTNQATSGFTVAEKVVIDAAIDWWEMLIHDMEPGPGVAGIQGFSVKISKKPRPNAIGVTIDFMCNAANIPISATIELDDSTMNNAITGMPLNFFVDPTPHANQEFDQDPAHPQHFTPKPAGLADPAGFPGGTVVDLLEVAKHELGHALGWTRAYPRWLGAPAPPVTIGLNGTDTALTYDLGPPLKTATVVGGLGGNQDHLNITPHPEDLMGDEPFADLNAGHRWVQSQLDIDVLSGIFGYAIHPENLHTAIPTVSEWGLMVMTLLLLTAGTVVLGRRRGAAAA